MVFAFRTGLGRARAWLHLALMQKKVADYLKTLLDRKDLLRLVIVIRQVHSTPSITSHYYRFTIQFTVN